MKLAAKIAGVVYRWELSEISVHIRVGNRQWYSKACAGKTDQTRCDLLFSSCFAGKNVQNFGLIREQAI